MEFSRQEYWSKEPVPSARDLPDLGIEPRSPALQAHSLPSEPPGKPKNTGVFLLEGNFPTQESNQGLQLCRQIIYQLSYQGNPIYTHCKNEVKVKVVQSCPTLCNPRDCSQPGSSGHGNSPGKNTGVNSHALLQGIFLT